MRILPQRLLIILLGMTLTTLCFSGQTFAQRMRIKKNVPYLKRDQNTSQDNSLDIYAPAKKKNCPVVIWIHGGGWKLGDKSEVNLKPNALTKSGYVLVSINYRLHPKTDIHGQAADVAAAIHWVKTHIDKYDGDPENIVLMGHSAGAHLSALVGIDPSYLKQHELTPKDLKGVILLDGACYHVADHIRDIPEAFFRSLFLNVFGSDAAEQEAVSPTLQISKKNAFPEFLIIYVANRKDAEHQSGTLEKKLNEAGGTATLHAAEGVNHATLNFTVGNPRMQATKWVWDFLKEVTSDQP